jgi:hypothetical protein
MTLATSPLPIVLTDPERLPDETPLGQTLQHPREHRLVGLHVDQPTCPGNRRVVGRPLVQCQTEEAPYRQRVRRSSRHPALRAEPSKYPSSITRK